MLRDDEWRRWSDGAIADQCKVSVSLVNSVRREMYPTYFKNKSSRKSNPRKGKDGRITNTSAIGRGYFPSF